MAKMKERQLKKECQILVGYLTRLLHLSGFTAERMVFLNNIVKGNNIDLQTEQGADSVRRKTAEMFGIKSAMVFDILREMDYLIYAPLEILYCMVDALTFRYQKSIGLFPEITFPELTAYINRNKTFLRDAVKNLRDDIAHPERDYPISEEYIGEFFDALPDAGQSHEAKMLEILTILQKFKEHLLKYA